MTTIKNKIFCDWISVSQAHEKPHQPVNGGTIVQLDTDGEKVFTRNCWKQISGKYGTLVSIRSDGHTVQFQKNISAFNKKDNYQGINLDNAKKEINKIIMSEGLPPFTAGKIIQLKNKEGTQKYTGAIFSRIDTTVNLATGSQENRDEYLRHIQTQTFKQLSVTHNGLNTTYGKDSESKKIRIYDKAMEVRETKLKELKTNPIKNAEHIEHLKKLIAHLEKQGIIRFELQNNRIMRYNDMRFWHKATHENLSKIFLKDYKIMNKSIEANDLDEIPYVVKGTLAMYLMGIEFRSGMHIATFYRHKKILKKYGYDISNNNIKRLKPKQKTIVLKVADIPDWYEVRSKVELGTRLVK